MRILIEDKDICTSTTKVFEDSIPAALYLSQISEDWIQTAGISEKHLKLANQIKVKMVNVARGMHKGLLGPGDDVNFEFDGMTCWVSFLEDAGKHTGKPWQNAYAFGPLSELMTLTVENSGWPNMVSEAPRWIGCGHSPDGEQY